MRVAVLALSKRRARIALELSVDDDATGMAHGATAALGVALSPIVEARHLAVHLAFLSVADLRLFQRRALIAFELCVNDYRAGLLRQTAVAISGACTP
jgi:hypothetical protein